MTEAESNEKTTISVVYCKPGERAETVEMEEKLETMQAMVGGLIQEFFPFHSDTDPRYDDVALICNDEGKLMQMKPSRAIFDEDGHVMDVIAGPFFLCYAPIESERFLSMPPDLEEEFRKKYELPERIYRTDQGFDVIKFDPGKAEKERGYER